MALTSFKSDEARIKKESEMSTFEGRYRLCVPGQGINMPFQEDPQIRLQKFGANIMTNTLGIESDLMGRNKYLTRDIQEYTKFKPNCKHIPTPTSPTFVSESRAELPAWTFRGVDNYNKRFESPWINPQANIEKSFIDNVQSRLLDKDREVISNTDWNSWFPR